MAGFKGSCFEEFVKGRNVLVVGVGGGGDVVGAIHVMHWVKVLGARKCFLGSVVWERFVIDPEPGPVPLECLRNARVVDGYAIVTGESYAVRGGRVFKPQAVNVAKALGIEVACFDASKGAVGLSRGFESFARDFGVDLIVGVDVGGDILASGDEDNLWSPLLDSVSLAALYRCSVATATAVHCPGCDGELTPEQVLKRVSEVAARGGLLCVIGISRCCTGDLERALSEAVTEASRAGYSAFRGVYGTFEMRCGSRKLTITPLSTVTYVMDTEVVYSLSKLAQAVRDTSSIWEARDALNRLGVPTELDLEIELKAGCNENLNSVRKRILERLGRIK